MVTLEWHPFPKDKPEKTRNYLATYRCGKTRQGEWNYIAGILNWNGKNWKTADAYGAPVIMTDDVVAWMEIPDVYKKEEN